MKRIRTVKVNDRGQIVIPEEMRKDFGIKSESTLVIIEGEDELVLRKEEYIMEKIDEEGEFWKKAAMHSLKQAWEKEDAIWDKFYKEGK